MRLIDVDDIHFVWTGTRKNGKTVFAETFEKFFNEIIEKAPTVDAVPVKNGNWIIVRGLNGREYRQCSRCLTKQELTAQMNYCPHCGARMVNYEAD